MDNEKCAECIYSRRFYPNNYGDITKEDSIKIRRGEIKYFYCPMPGDCFIEKYNI